MIPFSITKILNEIYWQIWLGDEKMNVSNSVENEILKIRNLYCNTDTLPELEIAAKEAKDIYIQNQTVERLANEFVRVLDKLSSRIETEFELEGVVEEVKRVYDQHQSSEDITCRYVNVLSNLSLKQSSEIKVGETAKRAERLYGLHQSSVHMANVYLCFLGSLIWNDKLEQKIVIQKAKRVYDNHRFSENIAIAYINLFNTFYILFEESEKVEVAEEAKRVYNQHQPSENVASEYLLGLSNFSTELRQSSPFEEAKRVYDRHQSSENIASIYLEFLGTLYFQQHEKNMLEKVAEEAKKVYVQHECSEKVSDSYVSFLTISSLFIVEEAELKKVTDEIKVLYYKNQSSEYVAKQYLEVLMRLIKKQVKAEEIKETAKIISTILQKYSALKNIVEISIDSLIFYEDSLEANITRILNVLTGFTEAGDSENPLRHTKYAIIFDSFKNMSDEERNRLIQIFCLVQKIKHQLIVKDPKRQQFGHYTSGKVLQIFLKQRNSENDKYEIETRSRLNNVNYMNDPSEGRVLDQFLGLNAINQNLSLKPSPWFLMSLTTAIDCLEMWAQYGDKASGVCLVLNNVDFAEVYHSSVVPTFKPSKRSADKSLEIGSVEKQEIKDFIYRICYLSNPEITDTLVERDYNKALDKDEIELINNSLVSLKSIVENIDQNSTLYEVVDECLEEIRYLFKFADYSYESELRILKYSPLESDNKNIKIDDSGEVAKLYIERETPIQIKEVIFGPKFPNPENVTPLLQLLDKNIKFRQSKIPFK